MDNQTLHRIYTIILSWNNYEDIKSCIDSIKNSKILPEKIVIVDNNSTDGSIEIICKDYANENMIHIIRNQENYGFAKGVNIGINYALEEDAEYIFLLNDDAILAPDCFNELLSAINFSSDIGLSTPRIFYANSHRIWQGASYFSFLKAGVISVEKNKLIQDCSSEQRIVSCATGCALLIRREVIESIGLFDSNFFFYFEDLDFTLRAKDAAFKITYVPSAKVYHKLEDISKDRTSAFVMYNLAKNNLIFIYKNFSILYFIYAFILHMIAYTPYRMYQIIKGSQSLKSAKAWFKGTFDGIAYILNIPHNILFRFPK